MRVITTVETVYTFAELSEEAQQKAITEIREKLDGPWWDSADTEALGEAIIYSFAHTVGTPKVSNYGSGDFPGIPAVKMQGWDVERGGALALDGYLDRDNAPSLPWVAGIIQVALTSRRSDHTSISIELTDLEEDEIPPADQAQQAAMDQAVRNAISAALTAGREELEYKTGEEYAREWAATNDHQEYNEDGTLYQ